MLTNVIFFFMLRFNFVGINEYLLFDATTSVYFSWNSKVCLTGTRVHSGQSTYKCAILKDNETSNDMLRALENKTGVFYELFEILNYDPTVIPFLQSHQTQFQNHPQVVELTDYQLKRNWNQTAATFW